MLAGEVGDDSQCCNWTVEDGPIEFGDDVGATLVLRYHYERTEVSHTHFAIETFLDSGISDEDEVAECEVILDNGGSMLLFESDYGLDSSSIDVRGECCQVRPTFLKGNSMLSNEVGQGKRSVWQRTDVSCFGNIEGQKRVCAGGCEVQETAHMAADCDLVGPHDGSDDGMPSRLVTIAGFE